jgi:hypothetical protein
VHIIPADNLSLIVVVFNALAITNGEAYEMPLGKQRTSGTLGLIGDETRFMHNQVYHIVSTATKENLPRATELCSAISRVLRTKG